MHCIRLQASIYYIMHANIHKNQQQTLRRIGTNFGGLKLWPGNRIICQKFSNKPPTIQDLSENQGIILNNSSKFYENSSQILSKLKQNRKKTQFTVMSLAAKRLKNKPTLQFPGLFWRFFQQLKFLEFRKPWALDKKFLEKSSSFWGKRWFFVTKSNINSNTYD